MMTREYALRRAEEMRALADNMRFMARNIAMPSYIRYQAAVQASAFDNLQSEFIELAKEIAKK